MYLKWSRGNEKLVKTRTVSFNLPAFKSADGFQVCPQAGACRHVCYARQGRHQFPDAKHARELNLLVVRGNLDRFVEFALADLARIRARSIRIHDSGDFFSQAYLDAWFRIMRAHPHKRFYCYTKSLHLDWTAAPLNLTRVQSAGGKLDHLIDRTQSHARIFPTDRERQDAGYVDGNRNDKPAQRGDTRIGLVYHGAANLSPKFAAYFRKGTE